MPADLPSPRRSQRPDHAGARMLAAILASLLVNAGGFTWALSADTLRALRDRDRVRQVAVASLTQDEWEANREVRPPPRVPRPRVREREPMQTPPPPPAPRAQAAQPPAAPPSPPSPAPGPSPAPTAPPASAQPPAQASAAASRSAQASPQLSPSLPSVTPQPPTPPPTPPRTASAPPAPRPKKERPAERPSPLVPPDANAGEVEGEAKVAAATRSREVKGRPGAGPAAPDEHALQVVELGPDAGPEVEPDEGQPVVLADRSSRAKRNTVARERQADAEEAGARPRAASEGKPGDPASGEDGDAKERVAGKPGVRGDEGEGEDDGRTQKRLALAPAGELPRVGDGDGPGQAGEPEAGTRVLGSREPDLRLSKEAIVRITRGTRVTVEGADVGEATTLNARRYGEARYIARVANLPYPYWDQKVVENAKALEPFLDRPRVTEITFQLDRRGHISGLRVSGKSGVDAIDRLALEVVQSAAPYPPLPDELATRGLTMRMRFRWEPQGLAGMTPPVDPPIGD